MLSIKAKEAIKTALAFVLVYWIALQSGWMNPYWAGFAVAMISLSTAGESIHKGLNRMAGTIPGCIAGLVILSMAPQSRWVFLLLVCGWIFFTTFMQLRSKNNPYMWTVAGFVCLIITLSGAGSSVNAFEHAVFRTLETAMGIMVYTLITVFLWPQSNTGAIRKASRALVATQAQLLRAAHDVMLGRSTKEQPRDLHTQEVQQLGQFAHALQAEGSESHEVQELRHLLERLHGLATAVMETLDRWQAGFAELTRIDMSAAIPDLQTFFDELDERFEEVQRVLGGAPPGHVLREGSLNVDNNVMRELSHLDRAALLVTKRELENLEALTVGMLHCARDLVGESADENTAASLPPAATTRQGSRLPVLDPDHLKGAAFAVTALVVGFLIWVFVDPPGHAGWYQMLATAAMVISGTPQIRSTVVIKPFAIALPLALAVYVLIMPQLSSFLGLGLLLFLGMFITRYFFSGFAQMAGSIGIINMMAIQNQQSYSFAAMANSYLFIVLSLVLLFVITYMLRSPRPEKAVPHLLRRFFRSAEYLVSRLALEPGHESSALERYKTDFYRQELQTLPTKIAAWGKAINHKLFPNNTPEQIQALVISLQTLVYRIEELVEAGGTGQAAPLAQAMREDFRGWRAGIEATFAQWSSSPETDTAVDLQEQLATWLTGLEQRIGDALRQTDTQTLGDRDGENAFRLLGGFRGVSEAAVAYAGVAATIDWEAWQEEVFQ